VALILFALAPVNDLFNLLLCVFAVHFFRKPERNRVGQGVIIDAAFLVLVVAQGVYRRGPEGRGLDCCIWFGDACDK
jgi:hypothetical protein